MNTGFSMTQNAMFTKQSSSRHSFEMIWKIRSVMPKGSFTPSVSGSISVDAENGFYGFTLVLCTQDDADVDARKWVLLSMLTLGANAS